MKLSQLQEARYRGSGLTQWIRHAIDTPSDQHGDTRVRYFDPGDDPLKELIHLFGEPDWISSMSDWLEWSIKDPKGQRRRVTLTYFHPPKDGAHQQSHIEIDVNAPTS